jgi:hypothetical protein
MIERVAPAHRAKGWRRQKKTPNERKAGPEHAPIIGQKTGKVKTPGGFRTYIILHKKVLTTNFFFGRILSGGRRKGPQEEWRKE